MAKIPIPLYIPNVLGYGRIILALVGLHQSMARPSFAIWIWILSAVFDLFDGICARRFNQCSTFGVFVDIAADNILRTAIWSTVAIASNSPTTPIVCVCVVSLEWFTMVATQLHSHHGGGTHWKKDRENDPNLIKTFFGNNFRNPMGSVGIYGLFASGIFTFASHHPDFDVEVIPLFSFFKYIAYFGRLMSGTIEVYLCYNFLKLVIDQDQNEKDEGVASKTIESSIKKYG